RPAVMLCDEPTSALDAETTGSVLETLRTINARLGVTIVVVTHELAVVRSLCRHVGVIENGALVEQFDVARATERAKTRLGRALARPSAVDDALAQAE